MRAPKLAGRAGLVKHGRFDTVKAASIDSFASFMFRSVERGSTQMIGYVTIGALDFEAALVFYDAVLATIGGERKSAEGGWAFYGSKEGEPDVAICKPFDGQPARPGNGMMIAFAAPSREAVAAAHAAALASGGSDEGAPGMRPPDGTSFYGAYMRDPTGNKLCVFNAI